MAKATIGGVDYEVRPFKLREVRKAAPLIDAINERRRVAAVSLVDAGDGLFDLLGVIAVGIDGTTAEDLEEKLERSEWTGLTVTFNEILVEAGFKAAGEAKPAKGRHARSPSE